ncbi:hypothetical protein C7C56_023240 [Massilia glaciei]|uniref:Uncharacterized protein n=1 Tax=Massilia glaciei TaxID=1524097 RepID=A0A2U2HEL7_9BURK|nr:hypothetical protein C7C56_023240 [Massilia glaciei]
MPSAAMRSGWRPDMKPEPRILSTSMLRRPIARAGEISERRRRTPSTASATEVSRSISLGSKASRVVLPALSRKLTRPRMFLRNWYSSVAR